MLCMCLDTLYIQTHTNVCVEVSSCWSGLSLWRRWLFMLRWLRESYLYETTVVCCCAVVGINNVIQSWSCKQDFFPDVGIHWQDNTVIQPVKILWPYVLLMLMWEQNSCCSFLRLCVCGYHWQWAGYWGYTFCVLLSSAPQLSSNLHRSSSAVFRHATDLQRPQPERNNAVHLPTRVTLPLLIWLSCSYFAAVHLVVFCCAMHWITSSYWTCFPLT
jgi:hypothetical protein